MELGAIFQMGQPTLVIVVMIGIGAFNFGYMLLTGTVPRWPSKSFKRDDRPVQFGIAVAITAVMMIMLIYALVFGHVSAGFAHVR
jgi:hypothetical protein